MAKLGIIIIAYNSHRLLRRQIERINKHCKDDFKIIIIDNSTDKQESKHIKYISSINNVEYVKTNASSQNGSSSHAFAANFSWLKYNDSFSHYLYLDHDCFPIKDFSIEGILSDDYIMAGIGQEKSKTYLWPGCLMFKSGLDIDFSVNHEHKLDTGGNLYKIVEAHKDQILFFDELHKENPEFTKNMYNFYSLINDGMFMHFVNGSGWNDVGHHEERLNSLINVLDKL